MRYTQGQVRDLLGVDGDTIRRWREAVPSLARRKGHGPTFSPGDVVALALLSDLVNHFGVRVNALSARLDEVFEVCNACSWGALESCAVVISTEGTRIVRADQPRRDVAEDTSLIIALRPIVERLRASLIAAEADGPQAHFQFPPTAVTAKTR